ncbi:alginate lyase family protein [Streptomyces sp. NPDC051940]|uniref:alginate lyase family protein n=1 Tax=Streptomyces sp. NPDC051940 TaxID=3155675 RepID=UPI0034214461
MAEVPHKSKAVRYVLMALAAAIALAGTLAVTHGTAPTAHADRQSPRTFTHPGVLDSRPQLDAVRRHLADGDQPWSDAYTAMRASKYAAMAYAAKPVENVQCPFDGRPGHGCTEEREDAIAAYTQALLWYFTRDEAHAEKATQIMDAWSGTIRRHSDDNAGLQTAWSGSTWARAAELVRYTYPGWPAPRVQRFETMLRTAYLPEVEHAWPDRNGNWDLAMTDAAIGIAVFLEDRAAFDRSVARFRGRVPAYFYLASDGPVPLAPPGGTIRTPEQIREYWFKQPRYVDGIGQETCRNFMHVGYALAATAHIAETAWHQGVDLWSEAGDRMRAALDFHARYQLGAKAPRWLCGGRIDRNMGPDVEVAVNHLHNRMGLRMPAAERLAKRQRPAGTDDLFVAWETLTHAANPG